MANERRMIDAHDLWSDIMMLPHNGDMISSKEVEQAIMEAATVDAVEVVRCEKCLYRSQYPDESGHYKCGGLLTEDEELLLMVKPDFFCAYGERRGKDG